MDNEVKIRLRLDASSSEPELKRLEGGVEAVRGRAAGLADSLARMATSGFGLGAIGAGTLGMVAGRYGGGMISGFGQAATVALGQAVPGLGEHMATLDAVSSARERFKSDFAFAAGAGKMSEATLQRIYEKAYLPFDRMEAEGRLRIDRATNSAQANANMGGWFAHTMEKLVYALPDSWFR